LITFFREVVGFAEEKDVHIPPRLRQQLHCQKIRPLLKSLPELWGDFVGHLQLHLVERGCGEEQREDVEAIVWDFFPIQLFVHVIY
jgi:hypothetical protein